ncbi:hypothetical protein HK100_003710 [Physocladia obscura]|uniref:SAM domain-containing protein n=1 Tax=Physocladia obscura TaxID=109957 RepID=A0AAD5XAA9_9FUNG|nr:hypothetical protein HK100_003710 [Physocladia obscura]
MSGVRLDIVPKGTSLSTVTGNSQFVIEAGFDTEAFAVGTVLVRLVRPIKTARLVVEFVGTTTTRWETGVRLASGNSSTSGKKPTEVTRAVAGLSAGTASSPGGLGEVLLETEAGESLAPNPTGGSLAYDFRLRLPRTNLPPTLTTREGHVAYAVRATLTYADASGSGLFGGKRGASQADAEVPAVVRMPTRVVQKLLADAADAGVDRAVAPSADRAAFRVALARTTLQIGDLVDATIEVRATPASARLRLLSASLRLLASYRNAHGDLVLAKAPRPLSEVAQNFQMLRIDSTAASEAVVRRVQLAVDPELALPTLESPLISIQTVFRLEIILDNSEAPNVSFDVPITIVPSIANSPNMEKIAMQQGIAPLQRLPTATPSYQSASSSTSAIVNKTLPPSPRSPPSAALNLNIRPTSFSNPPGYDDGVNALKLQQQHYQQMEKNIASGSFTSPSPFTSPNPFTSPSPFTSSGPFISPTSINPMAADFSTLDITATNNTARSVYNSSILTKSDKSFSYTDYYTPGNGAGVGGSSNGAAVGGGGYSSYPGSHTSASFTDLNNDAVSVSSSVNSPNENWSVQMVADWVKNIVGCGDDIVASFISNQIDGSVLSTLTSDDLKNELGGEYLFFILNF